MNFTHYDLGNLDKGRTVEVVLEGNAANVYLLDNINFKQYSRGLEFQAVGGLMKSSPVKLQTVKLAHWHVVVDLPGGHGVVKSSFRMLTQKMVIGAIDKLLNFIPTEAQKRAKPGSIPSTSALQNSQTIASNAFAIASSITTATATVAAKGVCRKCNAKIGGGRFCPECGEPTDKICAKCGTLDKVNGKFCVECGFKLG